MPKTLVAVAALAGMFVSLGWPQETAAPVAKPTEHVLGTVTAVDSAAHTVTVKEDKTGTEHVILLADTKTLIKVAPGAKDLKSGTRIVADDLAVGDRVDVRGTKPASDPEKIAARSVVLMSARELQQAHQAQTVEWQHSTPGIVSAVDTATGKVSISARTAEGRKPVTVDTSAQTEFTRYSPESPGSPATSQLASIQAGDQVRVIGDASEDGTSIKARKIYSGAFRTVNGTVTSVAADGKSMAVKDLATRKPLEVGISEQSSIRRLPPMLAAGLARRLNGGSASPTPGGQPSRPLQGMTEGSGGNRMPPPEMQGSSSGAGMPGMQRPPGARNGDISGMIERLPKMSVTELKPGDAVIISGAAADASGGRLFATTVIAGVEPILQSPAGQRGQTTGGDWGLGEISVPQ